MATTEIRLKWYGYVHKREEGHAHRCQERDGEAGRKPGGKICVTYYMESVGQKVEDEIDMTK